MQKIVRIAAFPLAGVALVLLGFGSLSSNSPVSVNVAGEPAQSPAGTGLQLRWSRALSAADPAGNPPAPRAAPAPGSRAALALASAPILAFGAAFWLGSALRVRPASARRQAAQAMAPRIERILGEAVPSDTVVSSAPERTAEQEALARMAEALEERGLEVQSLEREIAQWQDHWRLTEPRLVEQHASIEELKADLSAARSTVAGMRRYVGELKRQGISPDAAFADDIEAWIARLMSPVSRA